MAMPDAQSLLGVLAFYGRFKKRELYQMRVQDDRLFLGIKKQQCAGAMDKHHNALQIDKNRNSCCVVPFEC
jgi:hypothetical protein